VGARGWRLASYRSNLPAPDRSRAVDASTFVPTHRCGAAPDSHRIPSGEEPLSSTDGSRWCLVLTDESRPQQGDRSGLGRRDPSEDGGAKRVRSLFTREEADGGSSVEARAFDDCALGLAWLHVSEHVRVLSRRLKGDGARAWAGAQALVRRDHEALPLGPAREVVAQAAIEQRARARRARLLGLARLPTGGANDEMMTCAHDLVDVSRRMRCCNHVAADREHDTARDARDGAGPRR